MYIKKILWVIAIIGLVGAGIFAYYIYNAMLSPNTAFDNEDAYIFVPTDANYAEVREQLQPLLKDIGSFDAVAKQKKYTTNLKSGRFVIKKGMSNNDIINSIRSKNLPITIAFNNQENLAKLAGRISGQIEADSLSLISAMTDPEFLKASGFNKQTALGMYIPNSYEFFWNSSAETFRNRMLKEYNRFWNDARKAKAESIGLTRDQVLTLASIVHEESKQASEQPRIAGVYMNRIRIGMPLQADPTLKYAAYQLPKYQNTVIKRVLNVHKDIESPYNTYMNRGLPPGLIAMPDITAIDAVLNFEKHSYLYFAANANKMGFHKFAKTLAQHNVNAREYQRYLSNQGINK
ncbi:endolytic transglycosylase MltG [Subsaximicrobium wynnwilliamsii]|uniref:Endolytic murein transglycosylase n=1 Tax=Subsaximicrobium wynnwilliamsii TaxID=291179 RepID=A0A5C6ZIJ7_9FLAO|nr:endolytic transglycosylase MltG [Subsaximicrobium wynnwilliamsii]TXD83029.1 endolytic transglycosylase MltG [Subsaximicrobium wynnwilliamsii]TXD88773.1 endolytic transglycosylase MltG [Subsaximicrobium wynnwilliamsii]TXE02846.1 endolytic transglycosylase MltG [Subsaximicrobium wynnwilliamsii]